MDAAELVEQKAKDYGHPLDYCTTLREAWETLSLSPHRKYEGTSEDPTDYDHAVEHCLYMIVGKVLRVLHNPTYLDSIHDIAGYARALERSYEKSRGEEPIVVKHDPSKLPTYLRSFTLEYGGQHFAATPEEYRRYQNLQTVEHKSKEEAARIIYDQMLKEATGG